MILEARKYNQVLESQQQLILEITQKLDRLYMQIYKIKQDKSNIGIVDYKMCVKLQSEVVAVLKDLLIKTRDFKLMRSLELAQNKLNHYTNKLISQTTQVLLIMTFDFRTAKFESNVKKYSPFSRDVVSLETIITLDSKIMIKSLTKTESQLKGLLLLRVVEFYTDQIEQKQRFIAEYQTSIQKLSHLIEDIKLDALKSVNNI